MQQMSENICINICLFLNNICVCTYLFIADVQNIFVQYTEGATAHPINITNMHNYVSFKK